jgi:predicted Rossmann-fold nucleotide-binding protein
MRISCFGSSTETPSELYDEMKLVGKLLALRGVGIATGAFGGIGMQAAPEGATAEGGIPIVGYTYGGNPANRYVNEVVDCQKLATSIPFDAEYCVRLAGLLSSDAFIIAGGGGAGTFLELIATINFNQKFWKPMKRAAILETRDGAPGTWNDSMLAALKTWGVMSEQVAASFRSVNSAQKAVLWACDGVW